MISNPQMTRCFFRSSTPTRASSASSQPSASVDLATTPNRQFTRLEITLTHSKQRPAMISNRQYIGAFGQHSRAASHNCSIYVVAFSSTVPRTSKFLIAKRTIRNAPNSRQINTRTGSNRNLIPPPSPLRFATPPVLTNSLPFTNVWAAFYSKIPFPAAWRSHAGV
jgi:hypothetical protein